jgi:hypothetical protein
VSIEHRSLDDAAREPEPLRLVERVQRPAHEDRIGGHEIAGYW